MFTYEVDGKRYTYSKEIGQEEVNKHEIYIKFICTPEKVKGVNT